MSIVEAALDASRERLRPILMTVFTMIVGMLPLVFSLEMRFGDSLRIDTSGRFAMTAFRLNDCTALPLVRTHHTVLCRQRKVTAVTIYRRKPMTAVTGCMFRL